MGILSINGISLERIKSMIRKKRSILRKEGCLSLFRDISLMSLKLVVSYDHFYLYEHGLNPSTAAPEVACSVDNLKMERIFLPITLEEYERHGREGVDWSRDPRRQDFCDESSGGTIVFYTYYGDELVNRTGMTLYRNGVYRHVYPARMDDGMTVYAGFSETNERFRKKGIYTYVHAEIYKYLAGQGFSKVILLEAAELTGVRKIQDKLGSRVLWECYHVRILYLFDVRWRKGKASGS